MFHSVCVTIPAKMDNGRKRPWSGKHVPVMVKNPVTLVKYIFVKKKLQMAVHNFQYNNRNPGKNTLTHRPVSQVLQNEFVSQWINVHVLIQWINVHLLIQWIDVQLMALLLLLEQPQCQHWLLLEQ